MSPVTGEVVMEPVSIPLRSDFNVESKTHMGASNQVSIPLRSDFNQISTMRMLHTLMSFNPSKV